VPGYISIRIIKYNKVLVKINSWVYDINYKSGEGSNNISFLCERKGVQ